MFSNFSSHMKELDGDFVFVNKTAKSASLSNSKAGEKSWMDSHVRKRNGRKWKQSDVRGKVKSLHPLGTSSRNLSTFGSAQATAQSKQFCRSSTGHGPQETTATSKKASAISSHTHFDQSANVLATLPAIAGPLPLLFSENQANADGHRSLAFFRQRTLLEAVGWADDYFWNHVALPMTDTQPSMFFALASLGSLHESLSSRDTSVRRAARNKSLHLCNEAIKLTMTKDKDVPLVWLLPICVVFTAIQMFEGAVTAHANLRHGIQLADAARKQSTDRFSLTELDILDTVEELFERYQCRLTMIMEPASVLRQWRFVLSDAPEAPAIPNKFNSLYEARVCLERLNMWSYQLASTIQSPDGLSKQIQPYHDRWLCALPPPTNEGEDLAKRLESSRPTNLLKAARIASFILVCTMYAETQTVYDRYTDLFRQIVELYEPVTACMKAKSRYSFTFGFDAGLIETLSLVGSACRESKLRQRAIDMLHETDRVEGAITSRVAALIGAQWKVIEEDHLTTDVATPEMIPESRRVRLESLHFYTTVDLAKFQYIRAPYVPGAETIERWFKLKEAHCGKLSCSTKSMNAIKDLGPAQVLKARFAAGSVKTEEKGTLPWPEAFAMKSGRLFFPIPRV